MIYKHSIIKTNEYLTCKMLGAMEDNLKQLRPFLFLDRADKIQKSILIQCPLRQMNNVVLYCCKTKEHQLFFKEKKTKRSIVPSISTSLN